ncbi:MAG: hypothetical protein UY62_C0036G0013 [Parcubacteria group bacterium GW2011_GWF2_50_9]|nr:MAG: hypothetical protein UY62_C0036G0013 [Parcubacteria group bacterium GW2011_GWF2_50_9]
MRVLSILISLVISAAALLFAFHGVDMARLVESLRAINYPSLILTIPLFVFVEFYLRAVRWKFLLPPSDKPITKLYFHITAAGFLLNDLLPLRAGELLRAYWTHDKTKIAFSRCLAALFADRVLDALVLFLLFLPFFHIKPGGPIFSPAFMMGTVFIFLSFVLLWIVAMFSEHWKNWAWTQRIPRKLTSWLGEFLEGLSVLKNPRILFPTVALAFASWLVVALYVRMMAPLFSLHLNGMSSVWLMCTMQLAGLVPSAPANIGTQEAAGIALLQWLGYCKTPALSFVLVLHAAMWLGQAFWGFPAIWLADLHIKLSKKDES